MTASTAEYDAHLAAARSAVEENPDLVEAIRRGRSGQQNYLPLIRAARGRYHQDTGEVAVVFLMASLVGQVVRREI